MPLQKERGTKMKIYISLPISGHPIKKARETADMIQSTLSRKGHTVVNPFNIDPGVKEPRYEDYICADLRQMLTCDAVYFAPGWGLSTGCGIEFDVARRINTRRISLGEKPIKLIFGKHHQKIR